jgi:hypothetical protein
MIPELAELRDTVYQFKPKYIYVAGSYSGGDTILNVRNAILAGEELFKRGFVPYVPHLLAFWHFLAPHEYHFWLDYDLAWLEKCEAVLRLSGVSDGADLEEKYAIERGIPVYYSIDELLR